MVPSIICHFFWVGRLGDDAATIESLSLFCWPMLISQNQRSTLGEQITSLYYSGPKRFSDTIQDFRFEAFRSIEEVSRQSVPGVKKADVFLDQPACSWASNRESRWILIIIVDQYFQKSRWRYLEQILETAHRVNPANEMRTRKNNSGHRR